MKQAKNFHRILLKIHRWCYSLYIFEWPKVACMHDNGLDYCSIRWFKENILSSKSTFFVSLKSCTFPNAKGYPCRNRPEYRWHMSDLTNCWPSILLFLGVFLHVVIINFFCWNSRETGFFFLLFRRGSDIKSVTCVSELSILICHTL